MLAVFLSVSISVIATSTNLLDRHYKLYISIASTIFILLNIFFHFIAWLKRKRFYGTTPAGGGIPGPNYRCRQGSDLPEDESELINQYRKWTQKHGPTYLLWKGLKPCVVATKGIEIEQVLKNNVKKYNEGLDLSFMRHFIGKGLICKEFYAHVHQTRIDASALNHERDHATLHTTKLFLDEIVEDFLRKMHHQNNIEVNMYIVVSQIMVRTLFAENFARELSRGETNYLFINLEDAKAKGHRQKEALCKLRDFLSDTLSNKSVIHKAIDESRTLGIWLASRMTDAEIVDQMMLLLLICQEIPSSLMSTISQYVALHADVQDGIMFEIRNVISHRVDDDINGIVIEELTRLHFTEATVKEGLRFAPPLPVIGRKCTTGDNLGGFNIPKGTPVLLSLYACQNDGKIWQYPNTFSPERHLIEETGRAATPALNCPGFQPFGSGPLQCPMAELSIQQTKLILGTFIHTFKFTQTESEIPKLHFKGVSLRPMNTNILLSKRGKVL